MLIKVVTWTMHNVNQVSVTGMDGVMHLAEKLPSDTETSHELLTPIVRIMAHTQKFSTLDSIYKSVGSLPPPRNGCTVQTMDRLTAQELEGSIIHKLCSNSGPKFALGFLINVIFATCRQKGMPNVSELTVPLKMIHVWDSCLQAKFAGYLQSSEVSLYNSKTESWNWVFDPGEVKEWAAVPMALPSTKKKSLRISSIPSLWPSNRNHIPPQPSWNRVKVSLPINVGWLIGRIV